MQSNQKNLRTAEADDQPNVDVTLEELLAAIDKEVLPPLEDGDITRTKLMEETGASDGSIRRIMAKLVKSGEWIEVPKQGKHSRVMTYRKAEK